MREVKLRRTKINSGVTILDSASRPDSASIIENWSGFMPRITVVGSIEPPSSPGVRWIKRNVPTTFREMVGAHMSFVPGLETCFIARPHFRLAGDSSALMKHVDDAKLDMAFGCHLNGPDGKPMAFVVSTAMLAHMMAGFNQRVLANDPWEEELHKWLGGMLIHRYFNATPFWSFLHQEAPVVEPAAEPEKPVKKKRK